MNILFCSTGINALGETFTLALYAQELVRSGHNCFFIAPKLGKEYLKTFGFADENILVLKNNKVSRKDLILDENRIVLKEFEKKASPDYILVADWHHYKKDGMSNNNTYSIYWFNEKTPIGTFDHVGFAPHGRSVKQDQISNVVIKRDFQEKEFPPLQDRFSFIIRPCPHHNNEKTNSNNIYYWGIYKQRIGKEIGNNKILSKYNIDNKSKIVFQPIGLWQERVIDKVFEEIDVQHNYYEETLFPILKYYLSHVNAHITYIVISGKLKSEVVRKYKNVTFIKIPPLKHDDFMSLLINSDLFVTDNLMSSNLGKAVFGNIVPLVFKNSMQASINKTKLGFQVSDFMQDKIIFLEQNNLLFRYRCFPIGLNELEDMYQNNQFANCFVESEFFDEGNNITLLNDLLLNNEIPNQIKEMQNKYINNNSNLYSAEEILNLN